MAYPPMLFMTMKKESWYFYWYFSFTLLSSFFSTSPFLSLCYASQLEEECWNLELLPAVTLMSRLRNHDFIAHFLSFFCLIRLPTSSPGTNEIYCCSSVFLAQFSSNSALVSPYNSYFYTNESPCCWITATVSRDSN